VQLTAPSKARLMQSASIFFKDRNLVVNEAGRITLTVVDGTGQPFTDATVESGGPEIAIVAPKNGIGTGIEQSFATITSRRGNESISTFVVVARVIGGRGAKVLGETQIDTGGAVYLSDPSGNVVLKRESLSTSPTVYAGKPGVRGRTDGKG